MPFPSKRSAVLALVSLTLLVPGAARAADKPEIVSVKKIWDAAPHSAFTDLIRFHDKWYCTFRESQAHVGGNGKIRVITSDDGDAWTSAALIEEEGVDLRVGAGVTALEGDDRVRGVRLDDGERIDADLVVVGIGVAPNVELAQEAGLAVEDGIVIDAYGRTSVPHVFAAGDCANHFDARYGRRLRLESVPNAVEQAKAVAATIGGKQREISALPWFWSDQYNLKLKIAGLNDGHDEVVLSGDPTRDRDFTCFYLRQGQLIAADCVNRPRDFMFSKQLLATQTPVGRAELARATATV